MAVIDFRGQTLPPGTPIPAGAINYKIADPTPTTTTNSRAQQEQVLLSIKSGVNPNDPNLTLEQLNAQYAKELEDFKAQTAAQLKADEEAFAKARAEIEAMSKQEQDAINQQISDYQAAQDKLRADTEAQAQAAALEQAKLQKQIADIKAQQESEAAKAKSNIEGIQRDSAEKIAASKKAGRSSGARPLLGGATSSTIGQRSQSLGSGSSLGGDGATLGANQTLGV